MSRPKLLDLFCGEGGAGAGYKAIGFDVTGIDLKPLGHRYPGEFIQADALAYLLEHGHEYDAIHASPPCQGYTIATAGNPIARAKHQRLIAATRELLNLTGKVWVIENVEQARSQMVDPILLCGRMFALEAEDADGERLVLDRHRLFESSVPLSAPAHRTHGNEQVAGVYGGSRRAKRLPGETLADVAPRDRHAARYERKGGYVPRSVEVRQQLLGIDWMSSKGMEESIPPVYAQHVGMQLLMHIGAPVAWKTCARHFGQELIREPGGTTQPTIHGRLYCPKCQAEFIAAIDRETA